MKSRTTKRLFAGFVCTLLCSIALPVSALTPTEVAKLLASDAAAGDQFGGVAVDGDTALIGALGDDDAGSNSGSAYVFTRSAGVWTEQAKLTASDAAATDLFGFLVAVDGDTALIGAFLDDDAGSASGSAYVFTRSGIIWTEQAKLTASDAAAGDNFGFSVAVDGDTALIGGHLNDDAGSNSGSAYVFTRSAGVWTEQAKLTASDAAADDSFGFLVAVDGDTALISGHLNDDAGTNSGSAYVFTRSAGVWTEQAKLTASDAAANDAFAFGVSVDGDTALIGAFADDDAGSASGSAYVFTRSGITWTEQAKLTASDAAAFDRLGEFVAVDGDTALIGSRLDDDAGSDSGSAYVFTRSAGVWTEQAKLTASDAAANDWFGSVVAVDGDTVLIGGRLNDDAGSNSGSAYVFSVQLDSINPTADAGSNQAIHAGQTVNLDGSESFDDTTASVDLLYIWSFSSVPAGSTAVLADANSANPSFVADVPGTFNVDLVVEDEAGNVSDSDTVEISSENVAPEANAGDDQVIVFATIAVLDGTGSSDADFDPLSFNWTLASAPAGSTTVLVGPATDSPSLTPDLEGIYTVDLVVNDSFVDSASDSVLVTAIAGDEFSELKLLEANIVVTEIPVENLQASGHSQSLTNAISQIINFIQKGQISQAINKLVDSIERTDGCALRTEPDPMGAGTDEFAGDWVTDCTEQAALYDLLISAKAALDLM